MCYTKELSISIFIISLIISLLNTYPVNLLIFSVSLMQLVEFFLHIIKINLQIYQYS